MGEIARPSAPQREGFDRGAGGVLLVRLIGHDRVERRSSADAWRIERVGGRMGRLGGESAQRAVDMGERAVAQIHLRRQPFDRASNNARRVAGLDFAGRR